MPSRIHHQFSRCRGLLTSEAPALDFRPLIHPFVYRWARLSRFSVQDFLTVADNIILSKSFQMSSRNMSPHCLSNPNYKRLAKISLTWHWCSQDVQHDLVWVDSNKKTWNGRNQQKLAQLEIWWISSCSVLVSMIEARQISTETLTISTKFRVMLDIPLGSRQVNWFYNMPERSKWGAALAHYWK